MCTEQWIFMKNILYVFQYDLSSINKFWIARRKLGIILFQIEIKNNDLKQWFILTTLLFFTLEITLILIK